jgi:uncharacterized membrane protein YkvA (DUF1232 family)
MKLKLLWGIRRYLGSLAGLFFDRRVSPLLKTLTVVGALAIVSPIDLFSDIPVIGVLDDVTLLALLALLFVRLSPQSAVADYFG